MVDRPSTLAAPPGGTTERIDWSGRLARRTAGHSDVIGGILALANASGVINFSGGFPDPEVFPTEALASILDRLLTDDVRVALQYSPSEGIASTLDVFGELLLQREGIRPGPGELMVTSGGIDAITLLAKSLVDPADVVALEEPSYVGAVSGFGDFGATLRGVPMDSDGLDVDAFAAMLATGARPKLLYTIPEHQNPSGRTMSLARREALVRLCRHHGVLIVEDVAYRELSFDGFRQPSLWALDPEVTVQIGTFSKTIIPGVRLGWAAGPAEVIAQLAVAKQNSDQCAGALGQRMVEEFLREGHYEAQLVRARALYRNRGRATLRSLRAHLPPGVTWTEPTGGFFTWLHVPGVNTTDLALRARDRNVAFVPGAGFFPERVDHEYLRLSFSRITEPDIDEGIRRLSLAIQPG
ncbi:MAG TPA: PLP-dependent aminotransferase family protein [Actinophytocola sp.]|uniref:aminotransferase-like domain-containing protein n=1 Tax=Actinophytocola sp. TaxID=1872138 RepID=UPI002DDCBFE4|nr:PLP-dependent aminotransferase family protein [Actinophytocola sp.]HEV2782681.1 PLP-dependent aminotransferase family protein [Actinophytocola sp.]